jgi:uncharacterized protein involved in exopolysaccharide biosynthesis
MSADQVATDLGAERDIDLRGWLEALKLRWWIAVVGLVIGAVVGGLFALGGSRSYDATALIARGQAYAPGGGNTVLSYITSPGAIQAIATSEESLRTAAAKAGISVGELRGHVLTSTVDPTGGKAEAGTNSTVMMITVTLNRPRRAEDAANALAAIVQKQTTTGYVDQAIQIYKTRLANYATRLKTLQTRINSLSSVLNHPAGLSALDQLVISNELDSAQAAYGQTLDSQTANEQLLTLAQQVERTQILQPAVAQKVVSGRSARNSVVVGAVIGLLIGAIVALIIGLRVRRAAAVT